MAIAPEKLKYSQAQVYLPMRRSYGPQSHEEAVLRLIEDNDYWQGAKRYVGPLPAPGDGFMAGMGQLKKSYAPILKCREVLKRHVRGVMGVAPHFEIVLPELTDGRFKRSKRENYLTTRSSSEALADEVDELQGAVWDERGEQETFIAFTRRLRATSRAYLRYDVPPGLLTTIIDEETNETLSGVEAGTWQEAYRFLHLELAAPGSAWIYTDPATMEKIAFYSYKEPKSENSTEMRRCIQISWLEKQGTGASAVVMTRVRIVRDDGTKDDEWEMDTGGRLLLVEANMDALLTEDLLQLQDIECSIGTMIKVNSDVAGFPEKEAIDLDPPMVKVKDEATGEIKRVPIAQPVGPRTLQTYYSYQEKDKNGNAVVGPNGQPVVRQGRMQYREPVSSAPLRDDADWFELQIYRAVSQAHIPARTSANASAAMLVEMRADYADSLLETKPHVEKAMRETFHARLCAAAYLAGDMKTLEQFKQGRMRVDLQLNAGPLTKEERDEILNRYDKELLSKQTSMVLLGTEDVDGELAQIKQERQEKRSDGAPPVPKPRKATAEVI